MAEKPGKTRLDTLLLHRGLAESRERARALIMAGQVLADGEVADKPGREWPDDTRIDVKGALAYVSRGGLKLEAALDAFPVDPRGLRILDAGASTGGFTDCLLQRGAASVIAVDVGYGQFSWKLRTDPRVIPIERTNVRHLKPADLPHPVDAAVADLSFISLRVVLPVFYNLLPEGAWFIPLVKPQFEVGKGEVGKGGVVRDPDKIRLALDAVVKSAVDCGFTVTGEKESPITGPKGNREFLLCLEKPSSDALGTPDEGE